MPTPQSDPNTDEQEVQRLQQIIRDQRTTLDKVKMGTPAYQPALAAVLDATMQLVDYEAGIPVRRREIYSAHTAKIVKLIGLVTAAIIAVVAVLTITPWLSTWWLLLLVPLLGLAVLIATKASAATPTDRATRRKTAAAWTVTIGIDLALVIVSHWLPHWLTVLLIVITTIGSLIAAWELVIEANPAESNETDS